MAIELALGLFTVCANAAELDPLKAASPLYCAVMAWAPNNNDEVVKLAAPPVSGTSPEIAIPPSKKTTVPVAELGATVAVKVRESPIRDGLAPAVRAKPRLVFGLFTVWPSAGLTDAPSLLSPL